jgi:NitT/TauT family transport system permease protein
VDAEVSIPPPLTVAPRRMGTRARALAGGLLGPAVVFAVAALLWQGFVLALSLRTPIADQFGPVPAAQALWRLAAGPDLWSHVGTSLGRLAIGLAGALAAGIPLGLATGLSRGFANATTPLFQFLRMVSPLSWMPLAVIALGVGDAPVVFLLAFAALWPILMNTAAGVRALDPGWRMLGASLAATRFEFVTCIVLPGITAHVLTGVRLAIGLLWIVIVPAEMLGVSAGLGYFVLDTRDRLAYDELMAAIVAIGAVGWALDAAARALHALWTHAGD